MKYISKPLIFITVFLLGCGKKENEPPTPELSSPPKVFSPAGPKYLPPEAEVTAAKQPIQLTLRIYKKKIKLDPALHNYRPDSSLWYQLEIKNIGKQQFRIPDVFARPDLLEIKSKRDTSTRSFYLEIIDPGGQLFSNTVTIWSLGGAWGAAAVHCELRRISELQEPNAPKAAITSRRSRYSSPWYGSDPSTQGNTSMALPPGASLVTKPWMDHPKDACGTALNPDTHPIAQYSEVPFNRFELPKPGKYRVRAVYDMRPLPPPRRLTAKDLEGLSPELVALKKESEKRLEALHYYDSQTDLPKRPEQIFFRTPFIDFEIVPGECEKGEEEHCSGLHSQGLTDEERRLIMSGSR